MEHDINETIPYFIHEGDMARAERTIKRLFVLCIILIAVAVFSNLAWIRYENQFVDEVTVTQESDNGYNNYIGDDGDINN